MKYLLIIDGSYYHRWQTELCIESFKYHNLDKDLFVYHNSFKSNAFIKNLYSHENKICYKSSGNYFYDKLFVLKQFSLMHSEFCLIHPDMILQNPVSFYKENIVSSYGPETLNINKSLIENQLKDIIRKTDSVPELIPIGDVFIFKNLSNLFYESLIYNYKNIKDISVKEKGCFLISIIQSYYGYFDNKRYSLKIDALEQTLMHDKIENNFIHYKHGIIPNWSKNHYKDENISLNDFKNPFEKLKEYNLNSSVSYMLKIIELYLNSA